jgi:hypothetical protein
MGNIAPVRALAIILRKDGAAFVTEVFRDGGAVQDLVVTGVEAEVGTFDDPVADG